MPFYGKMQSVVSKAGCRRVNDWFTKGYTTAGVVPLWTSFNLRRTFELEKGSGMMEIFVNGEKTSCEQGITLEALVAELGYEKAKIAVEVNGDIVPKAEYEGCVLGEADRLEVVTFVGGG